MFFLILPLPSTFFFAGESRDSFFVVVVLVSAKQCMRIPMRFDIYKSSQQDHI